MKMIKRLVRVRKVERIFHLPIDNLSYDKIPEDGNEWKFIKYHFRFR